jgi:hypothetical protein
VVSTVVPRHDVEGRVDSAAVKARQMARFSGASRRGGARRRRGGACGGRGGGGRGGADTDWYVAEK